MPVKWILSVCFLLLTIIAYPVKDTGGTNLIPDKGAASISIGSNSTAIESETIIQDVPVYYWQNGCGPTSMGMIAGYYATHNFPDLIPGEAGWQSTEVDAAISSQENYDDYCYPEDTDPDFLKPDKSELPEDQRHVDNCIADYMGTSRSIKGNIYGWSLPADIKPAWENYISNEAPNYVGIGRDYPFNSFPWDSLVDNVDRNRPLIFLVDYTGDGVYDHFVCVIGYRINNGVNEYGCLDTWYEPVRWEPFVPMEAGVEWGILRCYTFEIHNKLPGVPGTISGNTSVCKNQSSVLYTVPEIVNATSYIWTLPQGAEGTSSTNSISVNFGTDASSGNISVKGHSTSGDGPASTLAVTVYSPVPAAGTISGSTTVCQGQLSVTYSVPVITDAATYIWTLPSGATGTSLTNSISVDYSVSAVSGNISVKGSNSCGDGTASSLSVTVNHLPVAAGTISGTATVCQGQSSVTYSVPAITYAASYIWTLPSGASGTSTTNSITVNYGASAISGDITVGGHNSCGDGTTSTRAITVNPLPSAAGTISGTTIVCQGQSSVIYTVPEIPEVTSYIWSLPSGTTGTSTTNSITVNYGLSAVSGNITVKGANSCGDGASSTLAVTVNPVPVAAGAISGSGNVCQGQSGVTYTVPEILHASSYTWQLPSGASGTSTSNSITVSYGALAVSGNITVSGTNSCGNGILSSMTIIVSPLPVAAGTISGTATICQGQSSVTYMVGTIANATSYIWTLPSGATGTSTTRSITVNYGTSAVSGDITVKGHNFCGYGTSSTLAITVNPVPAAAGVISGSTTICQEQSSVIYTVPEIENAASYIWTLPSGASGTSTTNSITVNYGASAVSGNITVRGNNSCGNGAISTVAVTVDPLPAAAETITGTSVVCQGQSSVTYTVPAINHATSYTWSLPSGASGSSTTNSITVDYGTSALSGNITVEGNNSCGNGTTSSLAVIVDPLPAAASTIAGTVVVCQGQSSVTYSVPAIDDATSYIWSLPSGASGSSTTNSITVNYSTSAVSGIIVVKGTNSCGEGLSSTQAITVNSLPETPIITLSDNVLHSDAPSGNQWYKHSAFIDGAINQEYSVTTNGDYWVIVTLDGCSSNTSNIISVILTGTGLTEDNIPIKVYPNPVADLLFIEKSGNTKQTKFEILNLSGRVVSTGNLVDKTEVRTSTFPAGVYFIKIWNGKSFDFKKFVKE
jgi:hypothetical protein